jgi:Olfactomedin-like domain.
VVFNNSFYYHKKFSNSIVQFDLGSSKIINIVNLSTVDPNIKLYKTGEKKISFSSSYPEYGRCFSSASHSALTRVMAVG